MTWLDLSRTVAAPWWCYNIMLVLIHNTHYTSLLYSLFYCIRIIYSLYRLHNMLVNKYWAQIKQYNCYTKTQTLLYIFLCRGRNLEAFYPLTLILLAYNYVIQKFSNNQWRRVLNSFVIMIDVLEIPNNGYHWTSVIRVKQPHFY